MLFQSPLFSVFLLLVVLLLLLLRGREARHVVLLLASYTFYAVWDLRYLSLLLTSTLVDHWVGKRIHASSDRGLRRRWLLLSVIVNLSILGTFKYFNFFTQSAVALAGAFGLALSQPTLDVVLPVGISFYTLQSMSYTFDIYRRRLEPEPSFTRFALYVGFFPQLVAGPIVRAHEFLPQLGRDAPPRLRNLPAGLLLFGTGLFKKVVIADQLALWVDPVFASPEHHGAGSLSFALVGYACQVYCDFSGYSDMAIGVGRVLGYRLPRNFNRPFASLSLGEFWRRWHITLFTWLRDYVFMPLVLTLKGKHRIPIGLMITLFLAGLWHGARWTFVAWGLAQGVAIGLEVLFVQRWTKSGAGRVLAWVWTMVAWFLLLIVFRAQSLADAVSYSYRLFFFPGVGESMGFFMVVFLVILMAFVALGQTRLGVYGEQKIRRLRPAPKMFLAGFLVMLAYSLSPGENRAFIYFQF